MGREREFAVKNKLAASERAIGEAFLLKKTGLSAFGGKRKLISPVRMRFFYSLPFSNQFLHKEVFKGSEFLSGKSID